MNTGQQGLKLLLVVLLTLNISTIHAENALRIAVAKQPASALMHIADSRGFFADEGLNVVMSYHPSGKRALIDGLFAGKADIATAAEVPVVINAFKRDDFRVLAAINFLDNVNRIIARKDAGIHTPGDLKGKRVATQKGSAVHYFLYLFLARHGLLSTQIDEHFMKAGKLPEALLRGEIDAFSMREPYISQAANQLGSNAILFAEPGLFPQYDVVVASKQVASNPALNNKLLRALLRAAQFAEAEPEQALKITATQIGADLEHLRKAWQSFHLQVVLDQSLLLALESEADWVVERNPVQRSQIPDMLKLIHSSPLREVAPSAVTLIE